MKLRPYKKEDAAKILSWIKNEREFRLWSADRYKNYPCQPSDINDNYLNCMKTSSFYALTLEDNGNVVGHLILRNPGEDKTIVRLGFIIIDDSIRKKGYGKKLIKEAIKYTKKNIGAKEINLGVLTNNLGAYECYKAAGFKVTNIIKDAFLFHNEKWDCAEMVLDEQL